MLGRCAASIALVLALATGSTAQTPTTAARPTAEQFAAASSYRSASLSPSGRYIVGIRQEGAYDLLVVTDLTTRQTSLIQRANETTGEQLSWADWKGDDRIIFGALFKVNIVTQERATGTIVGPARTTETFWIPRVISIARTGGAVTPMFEGQSNRLAGPTTSTRLVSRLPNDPDRKSVV